MAEEHHGNYVKVEVIAQLFGLTTRRVQQLTQDGVISTTEVKNPETGRKCRRYDLIPTVRLYIKYLSDKAYGRAAKEDSLEGKKIAEDIGIKRAKRKKLELELKEVAGKMHRSEDVETLTNDLIYTIRSMLLALPSRVAVDVYDAESPAEAADVIKKEVYLILNELSNHKYDPDKYAELVRDREGWDEYMDFDDEDSDDEYI